MSNNFGNTIAVGNLNDLAGILATLTPDQLQNVQLDPALHEALCKSIETTTVIPAGYQQQPINTQVLSTQTNNNSNALLNQQPAVPLTTLSQPLISVGNSDVGVVVTDGQLLSTNLISPQKTDFGISPNNMIIQQPTPNGTSSILASYNGTGHAAGYTVVPNQQTMVVQNLPHLQTDVTGIQGILPGEASSLILTPTVMSQVQPTATIQTINIADNSLINNAMTANLASMDSVIISQPVQSQESLHQTINICNQESLNINTQPANLTFQIPITSTSNLFPSTVTLDPNLLKKQAISLDSSALYGQNIQIQQTASPAVGATTSNQCVLVDGNILSTNDILALTSGSLPVLGNQQVLVSDIVASQPVFVNNLPHTYAQVSATQPTLVPATQPTLVPATQLTATPLKASVTPSRILDTKKPEYKATPLKKTKVVQTISTLTPDSPVFNPSKSNKGSSSSSNATSSNKNVIVTKKTINVIKKSEGQIFSMKPTSVKQVQPGIFKLQLKKVNSEEAAALLAAESSSVNSLEESSGKAPSLSSLLSGSAGCQRTVANLQMIGRNAQQVSINTPKQVTTSKVITQTTAEKTNTSAASSNLPMVCTISIKTNNIPRDVMSKLKDITKVGAVKTTKSSSQCDSVKTVGNSPVLASNVKKVITVPKVNSSKTSTPFVRIINGGGNLPGVVATNISSKPSASTTSRPSATATSRSSASTTSKPSASPTNNVKSTITAAKTITFPSISTSHSSENSTINSKQTIKAMHLSKSQTTTTSTVAKDQSLTAKSSTPTPIQQSKLSTSTQKSSSLITKPTNPVPKPPIVMSKPSDSASKPSTLMSKPSNSVPKYTVVKKPSNTLSKPDANDSKSHGKTRNDSIGTEIENPLDDSEFTSRDLECNERGFVSPAERLLDTSSSEKAAAVEKKPEPVLDKAKAMLEKAKASALIKISAPKPKLSPQELSEIETFREVIESTRAGAQENNMRELAKQEIEKQFKRLNDKKSKKNETSVDPSNKHGALKRKGSNQNPSNGATSKEKSSKIEEPASKRANMTPNNDETTKERASPVRSSEEQADKRISTRERLNFAENNSNATRKNEEAAEKRVSSTRTDEVALEEKTTPTQKYEKKRKKQSKTLVVEENRKRERPKKFDDFILAPDSKKEKKAKKFFFPKDDEKENESGEDIETKSIDDSKKEMKSIEDSKKKTKSGKDTDIKSKKQSKPQQDKSTSHKNARKSSNKNTDKKSNTKKKKSKKRKQNKIAFEPEVLPEHLKTKTKTKGKVEDTVIDVTKVKLKSSFTETSFILNDTIEQKTFKLLNRKSWLCTLCGKPGNLGSLDVLFGPYKINVKHKGGAQRNEQMNVWLHRDCAIWTSNICLSNQTLCGLGDSLDAAAVTKCCLCSQVGATLLCGFKQCRDGYHFVCAKQRGFSVWNVCKGGSRRPSKYLEGGCSFKMENFTITCPKH